MKHTLQRTLPLILVAVFSLGVAAPPILAAEQESSIARGGRLYDKWFKVIKIG